MLLCGTQIGSSCLQDLFYELLTFLAFPLLHCHYKPWACFTLPTPLNTKGQWKSAGICSHSMWRAVYVLVYISPSLHHQGLHSFMGSNPWPVYVNISRHRKPPAFSVWKLGPPGRPSPAGICECCGLSFLKSPLGGGVVCVGVRKKGKGHLIKWKVNIVHRSFLNLQSPSTSGEFCYFFHRLSCSPGRWAAVLRTFLPCLEAPPGSLGARSAQGEEREQHLWGYFCPESLHPQVQPASPSQDLPCTCNHPH